MNVILVAMVVSVVLASTLEYGEAIDGNISSVALCEQIRWNQRRILTMGARGTSLFDAHFYILAEGGYMFKLPLTNLHWTVPRPTIHIDRDYIRADVLFNVSEDIFSRKHHDHFFLISNKNKDAFVGRMFTCPEHTKTAFQLFDLNGVLSDRDHPQEKYNFFDEPYVIGSVGIDSYTSYAFDLSDEKLYRYYAIEADHKDDLIIIDLPFLPRLMMRLNSNSEIVTLFYRKDHPKADPGYYIFLNADGLVTGTRRDDPLYFNTILGFWKPEEYLSTDRFEMNLSSFVVCDFKASKSAPQTSTPTTLQTKPKQTANLTTTQARPARIFLPFWAILLGIGAIVVLCGIVLFTCWAKRKHRKNRKNNNSVLSSLGSSNTSSNANFTLTSNVSSNASSNATSSTSSTSYSYLVSKASSYLESVKSKLSSALKWNKSKQAKAVTKGKNSKTKKPK